MTALVKALEAAQRGGRPHHVVHFDGHGTTLPLASLLRDRFLAAFTHGRK